MPTARRARSAWASSGIALLDRLACAPAWWRPPPACARGAPPSVPRLRAVPVRPSISSRLRPSSCSRSLSTSLVCLRPRSTRLGHQLLGVVGGHAPALHGVLHRVLDPLAGEHHQAERVDQALGDRLAQLGDALGGDARSSARPAPCACRTRAVRLAAPFLAPRALGDADLRVAAAFCAVAARRRPGAPTGRADALRARMDLRRSVFDCRRGPPLRLLRRSLRCCAMLVSAPCLRSDSPRIARVDYLMPNTAATGAWSESRSQPSGPSPRARSPAARGGSTTCPGRATSRWSIALGPVGAARPKRSLELVERGGVLARAQVEVAAEDQRVAARERRGELGRLQHLAVPLARGRHRQVHAGHGQPAPRPGDDAGEQQRAALGPGRQHEALRTSSIRHGARTSDHVRPALARLDQVRVVAASAARSQGSKLREVSASAPLARQRRPSGSSQRGGASWSSATRQSQPRQRSRTPGAASG